MAYDCWWRGWISPLNENWGGQGTWIWCTSDGLSWTWGSSQASRHYMGMNSGANIILESVDGSDG